MKNNKNDENIRIYGEEIKKGGIIITPPK